MADAAAARREARRKKILENSHNRLQRISGKCDEAIPAESSLQTIIPHERHEVSPIPFPSSVTVIRGTNLLNNGVVVNEEPSLDVSTSSPSYEGDAAGDSLAEVASDLASLMSPAEPATTQQVTVWQKLILYKYDVVLVSLLVQLLYSFSILSFDETYFFLPLVAYVVTKVIWFPAPSSSSNFANALLLLNGISVQRVERIMSVMRWASMFSQDVCVYLFTTICMQALCTTITDSFIT